MDSRGNDDATGGSTSGSGGKSTTGAGGSKGNGGSMSNGASLGSGGSVDTSNGGSSGGAGVGGNATTSPGGAPGNSPPDSGSAPDGTIDPPPSAACKFNNVAATLSPKIPTVGIVSWATDLAGVTKAEIDFGLDDKYGMTAPVDLKEPSYRTLLLGMKAAKTYHYRIRATGAGGTCVGADNTITTGANNGGQSVTLTPPAAPKAFGGFLLLSNPADGGASIVDKDGDTVWYYATNSDTSSVRLSYDGKYMWTLRANCCTDTGANVHRISMDGMTDEDLSSKFTGANHMLEILPDDTVAFFSYGSNGCDDLKEYSPTTGTVKTIVNTGKANGSTKSCHTNQVQYSPKDDTLVFSDLSSSSVTKVKRTGETVWVLNGAKSTLGTLWTGVQHGINILDVDRLLVFNNPSTAIEITIDVAAKKATKVWSAKAPTATPILGDVQRLPNGNTLIMPSSSGSGVEVDAMGAVVQSYRTSNGNYGFIEKRATLYGPPIRMHL